MEIETVVADLQVFFDSYDIWRKENGLSGKKNNPYEVLTSMTDKLGRICRQVKHKERSDPKPDWPDGMVEDMSGLLIYMIILKNIYDVDIFNGMSNELHKAVDQHGNK